MSVSAPPEQESILVDAAAEAGVKWVFPNVWCPDVSNPSLVQDVLAFQGKDKIRALIKEKGMNSLSIITGYWYEWSLAFPDGFGFNFEKKEVTFFDEGEQKICVSTWDQIGRCMSGLLSLPIKHVEQDVDVTGEEKSLCLESFFGPPSHGFIYMNSFLVSQRDMFSSILRVTDDEESSWKITHVSSKDRFSTSLNAFLSGGDQSGFERSMYTRVFFADGCGDFTSTGKGMELVNGLLALPEENLDERTRVGVERAKTWKWGLKSLGSRYSTRLLQL
jgi:hypothetical protein